jgi:hypothetical protein
MTFAILCEQSGRVRDALRAAGHHAVSFDMLPSDTPGPHIQGDIKDFEEYILLFDAIIAFPPCTYLSCVGNRAMKERPARRLLRQKAFEFVMWIWNMPHKYVCIENPKGYFNTHFKKPTQIIQPYYFGDCEMKTTCLWMRGFPPLIHSEGDMFYDRTHTEKPKPKYICQGEKSKGKKIYFIESHPGGKKSAIIRATTFPGIAQAMADQWGKL